MTTLLLNKAHYPVTTLGPGRRAAVWFQGCTIGCTGCLARDTWPADETRATTVDVVVGWIASLRGPVDGVTVSGGEPFQQPDALRSLLDGVNKWRRSQAAVIGVLVYTGYPPAHVRRHHLDLVERCDAVIAGPYRDDRNTGIRWRGSDNQQVVAVTALGRARYRNVDDADPAPRVQATVEPDRIWYVGIPGPGELERARRRMEALGVTAQEVSWRP